jgi:hypothetical protein
MTEQEMTELVHHLYRTWNDRGLRAVAEEFWDEEIHWCDDPAWPDAREVQGRDNALARVHEVTEGLGDFKFDLFEFLPFEGGGVAGVRVTSLGAGDRPPVEGVIFHVGRFSDRRVTELRMFLKREDAMAAAGLQ